MKAMEVVQHLKSEKPNILKNIPEKKAAALIRSALAELGRQIDSTDDGVIKVQGLGRFRVRQVERNKNDQKVTVKRIVFHPMKSKKGTEENEEIESE